MKITVTTSDDKVFCLDVAQDLELENLKALCAMEIGAEVSQIAVIFNGRELSSDKQTLQQCGVGDGDFIMLERRRSANRPGERERELKFGVGMETRWESGKSGVKRGGAIILMWVTFFPVEGGGILSVFWRMVKGVHWSDNANSHNNKINYCPT